MGDLKSLYPMGQHREDLHAQMENEQEQFKADYLSLGSAASAPDRKTTRNKIEKHHEDIIEFIRFVHSAGLWFCLRTLP